MRAAPASGAQWRSEFSICCAAIISPARPSIAACSSTAAIRSRTISAWTARFCSVTSISSRRFAATSCRAASSRCPAGFDAKPERDSPVAIMHVAIGDQVRFSKTVGETDVYMFAGITGDFSGNHVNEEFMRASVYGRRIAHGALMIGYMSTCSTMLIDRSLARGIDSTPVSLGYDRIRFLGPVFLGDTITVVYTISELDA